MIILFLLGWLARCLAGPGPSPRRAGLRQPGTGQADGTLGYVPTDYGGTTLRGTNQEDHPTHRTDQMKAARTATLVWIIQCTPISILPTLKSGQRFREKENSSVS